MQIYIYIYIQPFKIPNSLHPQRFEPMNSWVNLLNSWTMNRWPAPEFSRTVPLLLVMGPWLEDEPILNLGKKMLSRSYPIGFWTCCHRFPKYAAPCTGSTYCRRQGRPFTISCPNSGSRNPIYLEMDLICFLAGDILISVKSQRWDFANKISDSLKRFRYRRATEQNDFCVNVLRFSNGFWIMRRYVPIKKWKCPKVGLPPNQPKLDHFSIETLVTFDFSWLQWWFSTCPLVMEPDIAEALSLDNFPLAPASGSQLGDHFAIFMGIVWNSTTLLLIRSN